MPHPHQAFIEGSLLRVRLHHRLERDHEAAVVQRGDDFVGDADVDAPLRLALDIRQPAGERARAPALGAFERLLRAADHVIGGARIARHVDAADRHRHRDGTEMGRHHVLANADQKPFGGDLHLVDRAVFQDHPELVAGEAPEHVAAAQPRTQAHRNLADHLVGDIEAERIVDVRQMIDTDDQKRERGAETLRFLGRFGQRRHQPRPVQLARERVLLRRLQKLLVARVALIDGADHALRARRPAVRACIPAAGFLDPDDRRGGCGPHAIFELERHALAGIPRAGAQHDVGADRLSRFDAFGEFAGRGQRLRGEFRQQPGDALAPIHRARGDIPDIFDMRDRCENMAGRKLVGRRHIRLVLGRRFSRRQEKPRRLSTNLLNISEDARRVFAETVNEWLRHTPCEMIRTGLSLSQFETQLQCVSSLRREPSMPRPDIMRPRLRRGRWCRRCPPPPLQFGRCGWRGRTRVS